jgi:hypothetical protein
VGLWWRESVAGSSGTAGGGSCPACRVRCPMQPNTCHTNRFRAAIRSDIFLTSYAPAGPRSSATTLWLLPYSALAHSLRHRLGTLRLRRDGNTPPQPIVGVARLLAACNMGHARQTMRRVPRIGVHAVAGEFPVRIVGKADPVDLRNLIEFVVARLKGSRCRVDRPGLGSRRQAMSIAQSMSSRLNPGETLAQRVIAHIGIVKRGTSPQFSIFGPCH